MKISEEKNAEERLLQAAEYEFLTKGYAGAKTTQIAANAGMTHTMLHYYFRTKEQLFKRVADGKVALLAQTTNVLQTDRKMPINQRIRLMVEQHFDILAQNPLLPRFIINIMNEQPDLLKYAGNIINQLAGTVSIPLQEDLDKAADNGEIARVSVPDLLFDIISVNFFTFMALPIGEIMMKVLRQNDKDFLARRREENVKIILKRIEK